jgi:putative transposase
VKDLKVPSNISLLPLPPRSPNSTRKHLAIHASELVIEPVFKLRRLVDHCCFAWNTLIDQPSIARLDWVIAGQSL